MAVFVFMGPAVAVSMTSFEVPTARMKTADEKDSDEVSAMEAAFEKGFGRFIEKLELTYSIDAYRTATYGNKTRAFKPEQTFQTHNATLGYADRYGDVSVCFRKIATG